MSFDVERWRSQVHAWWAERAPDLKSTSIQSAYTLLAASAWLPFLARAPAVAHVLDVNATRLDAHPLGQRRRHPVQRWPHVQGVPADKALPRVRRSFPGDSLGIEEFVSQSGAGAWKFDHPCVRPL